MADQLERADIQISLNRELLADVDRLSTLWDMYRYEVMDELLRLALDQVKAQNYKPGGKSRS